MSLDIVSFVYGMFMAGAFWAFIHNYFSLKTLKELQEARQNYIDALIELEKPDFVKIADEVLKEATQ